MKLKDKKIEICEYQYTTDAIGNHKKTLITVAKVWAYFRQLSGKEIETGISTKTNETALFQIGYRADLKTTHVIKYIRPTRKHFPTDNHFINKSRIQSVD